MLNKLTLSTLVLATSLFANANEQELIKKVKELDIFKSPTLTINRVIDNGTLLHIAGTNEAENGQKQKIEAFVTSDFEYVILGKAFSSKTAEELFIPIDMKNIVNTQAFKIGTGEKQYYLFTDPECPYCVTLEKDIIANLTENRLKEITVNVILLPLSFHKNAKSMSRYVLSKKDDAAKAKALKDIMVNKDKSYMEAKYTDAQLDLLDKELEKQLTIINQLGVDGTPTLLNSIGKRVNPTELIQ